MTDITMLTIALRTIRSISDEHAERCTEARQGPFGSGQKIRQIELYTEGQLVDFGFSIRDGHTGYAISFKGVRASSTAGISVAMSNWAAAAERRIGA